MFKYFFKTQINSIKPNLHLQNVFPHTLSNPNIYIYYILQNIKKN